MGDTNLSKSSSLCEGFRDVKLFRYLNLEAIKSIQFLFLNPGSRVNVCIKVFGFAKH